MNLTKKSQVLQCFCLLLLESNSEDIKDKFSKDMFGTDEVTVTVEGEDEEAAAAAMKAFFEANL